jgi:hypothetical protein
VFLVCLQQHLPGAGRAAAETADGTPSACIDSKTKGRFRVPFSSVEVPLCFFFLPRLLSLFAAHSCHGFYSPFPFVMEIATLIYCNLLVVESH